MAFFTIMFLDHLLKCGSKLSLIDVERLVEPTLCIVNFLHVNTEVYVMVFDTFWELDHQLAEHIPAYSDLITILLLHSALNIPS